jgi:hypothetical protein
MTINNYKFFLRSFMIALTMVMIILNVVETKSHADQFQIEFSGIRNGGSIVLGDGNPFSSMLPLDPFTGSLSYNLDAVDTNSDPTIGYYTNALTSLSLDFGFGFSGYSIAAADILVENESYTDSFDVDSVPAAGPDVTVTDKYGNTGVYSVGEMYLTFLDYNPPDAISSDALPTILPPEWRTPFVSLSYVFKSGTKVQNDYGQDYDEVGVSGVIRDAHVVPEPSTMLLLGSGLLGLVGFRKKLKK